jgi:hypothetical protein
MTKFYFIIAFCVCPLFSWAQDTVYVTNHPDSPTQSAEKQKAFTNMNGRYVIHVLPGPKQRLYTDTVSAEEAKSRFLSFLNKDTLTQKDLGIRLMVPNKNYYKLFTCTNIPQMTLGKQSIPKSLWQQITVDHKKYYRYLRPLSDLTPPNPNLEKEIAKYYDKKGEGIPEKLFVGSMNYLPPYHLFLYPGWRVNYSKMDKFLYPDKYAHFVSYENETMVADRLIDTYYFDENFVFEKNREKQLTRLLEGEIMLFNYEINKVFPQNLAKQMDRTSYTFMLYWGSDGKMQLHLLTPALDHSTQANVEGVKELQKIVAGMNYNMFANLFTVCGRILPARFLKAYMYSYQEGDPYYWRFTNMRVDKPKPEKRLIMKLK